MQTNRDIVKGRPRFLFLVQSPRPTYHPAKVSIDLTYALSQEMRISKLINISLSKGKAIIKVS